MLLLISVEILAIICAGMHSGNNGRHCNGMHCVRPTSMLTCWAL